MCNLCNRYVEVERHFELEHRTEITNECEEEKQQMTSSSSDTNDEINKTDLISNGNYKTISETGINIENQILCRY